MANDMTTTQLSASSRLAPTHRNEPGERLTVDGKRYLVRDHVTAVLQVVLALGFAGTLAWYNAWLFGTVLLAGKIVSALLLVRVNPAVVNARGTRHPMSVQDRVFFAVFIPATLAIPIVAALDVGGPGWSHHSLGELIIGLGLLAIGMSILVWALAVNRFFEPTVRIQREREHRVCTDGPYRYVRHPGYTGAIILLAGIPLIFGSFWCFVPAAITTIAFIVRTIYEDRLLHAELDGYGAYASNTRFRLVPFVW